MRYIAARLSPTFHFRNKILWEIALPKFRRKCARVAAEFARGDRKTASKLGGYTRVLKRFPRRRRHGVPIP
jgi:hypothetical protein